MQFRQMFNVHVPSCCKHFVKYCVSFSTTFQSLIIIAVKFCLNISLPLCVLVWNVGTSDKDVQYIMGGVLYVCSGMMFLTFWLRL